MRDLIPEDKPKVQFPNFQMNFSNTMYSFCPVKNFLITLLKTFCFITRHYHKKLFLYEFFKNFSLKLFCMKWNDNLQESSRYKNKMIQGLLFYHVAQT